MSKRSRTSLLTGVTLAAALSLVGCGGSNSAGSNSSVSTSIAATSAAGSSGTGGGSGAATGGVAAARLVVDKYSKEPTRFPVDQPLTKGLAAGQKIAFLQCAAPFCALLGQLYDAATATMGIPSVTTVKSGPSVDAIESSLSSVEATKPAALLLPAVNLGAVGTQVKKLFAAGIPVVGAGVMGRPEQGIDAPVNGPNNYVLHGPILADWAIVTAGDHADIVWYGNPEFDFTKIITNSFKAEMAKNCSACKIRYVDIPGATIGTTAPSRVVSDLQANPSTQIALFSSLETATGLPAALKVAGIKVKISGSAPVPANLQDMKTGGIESAVGLDAGVLAFTQVDAAVRLATKQPLTSAETNGDIPSQPITKTNLPGDVSKGFSAYPDFVQRFTALWAKARTSG